MLDPVVAWVLTGLLLVLLVASAAAARGLVRRNHFFGVRLPALMRSDAAWRSGHAASVLPAAVSFAVALVSAIVGLGAPVVNWGCLVAFVGGFVWVAVRASRVARAA